MHTHIITSPQLFILLFSIGVQFFGLLLNTGLSNSNYSNYLCTMAHFTDTFGHLSSIYLKQQPWIILIKIKNDILTKLSPLGLKLSRFEDNSNLTVTNGPTQSQWERKETSSCPKSTSQPMADIWLGTKPSNRTFSNLLNGFESHPTWSFQRAFFF